MTLVVLRSGVDTLEASFLGELSEEIDEKLDAAKARAQETNEPQPFAHTGLHVQPKGFGLWRWRLTDPNMELRLSAVATPGQPSASIRLSALGLATHDPLELYERAVAQLRGFGDFSEYGLSRLDVYADCQGWTPSLDEMAAMSCPASFRPIYPNVERPETFQFGKGVIVVRVYNKTVEIRHSHKAWVKETWRESGLWDSEQDVWRVETQVRTKTLGELGLRSVASALAKPGAVFDWTLAEWCQLRVPTADKKVTRWPEHPAWTQLREAVFDGKPCARAAHKARLLPLEDAAKRLVGLVATAAAHYGEANYIQALQRLSNRAEVHMISEHIEFADLITVKHKRLVAEIGDEWDDVPF